MNLGVIPDRIKKLPVNEQGYPVPWFVEYINGVPDFRVIDERKMARAVLERRCWICGQNLGVNLAFLIGPMCAINRTISEPPSHRECAEFSARVCPFLSLPKKTRDTENVPEGTKPAAGYGIDRNPGVTCLWMTRDYRPFRAPGGILFRLGDPLEIVWYAKGRIATRAEIMASLDSGIPLLRTMAVAESEASVAELDRRYAEVVNQLVPQEGPDDAP